VNPEQERLLRNFLLVRSSTLPSHQQLVKRHFARHEKLIAEGERQFPLEFVKYLHLLVPDMLLWEIAKEIKHSREEGLERAANAFTSYDGHRLTSDYKRALTRRRNTRVDCNFTLTTTDDVRLRLKPILVVDNRIRGSQEKLLRARTTALVSETISGLSLVEGLKRIYSGELARELAKDLRTIYLTRRVEIAKVELLSPAKLMDVPPSEEELERILTEEETGNGDDDETDAEVVDYESLTVPELKELLKAQKLPVSGKKAELVERLSSAGSNEEEEESDD